MKSTLSILFLAFLFVSCDVKPKEINYGNDTCDYCNMTVVDRQHASQIVTKKGRSYTFDAIECMINYDNEHADQAVAMYLANDFKNPGTLIDATNATYLISPEIKSPMGANLSGFNSKEAAEKTQEEYAGDLYNWKNLRQYFKTKR